MIKQIVFLRKRDDLSMDQFMDYYENQHSRLSQKMGANPALPNAQRYVRRYVTPQPNPLTGEVIDPGYDCIMEIWWNSLADYQAAMKGLSDPAMLDIRKADELQLFASNSNPVCLVEEHDSPMGPNGEMMQVQLVPQD
ncbi:EthD domain-containing protein [Sphingobium sp. BHU LFT2]|uniref:EthD domain-containing protein n=1 Tax=Sphingobium sp. BHU LFT2 TaxID=2807634 RepID=UPI001BEABAC8|nr:EthD domain-containing protein [Sphingobium sp. BHU LFT2]MBT2243200.1 EthD domain-containing protein [Sphingobium sp. BHU LFT2]